MVNNAARREVVFVHCDELDTFSYPAESPLVTKRAGMTRQALVSMGLLSGPGRRERSPVAATQEELEKFHTPRYLDVLRRAADGDVTPDAFEMGLGSVDCPIFPDMFRYPVLACGATLTAARLLLAGEASIAFNPSGGYHHAAPERASGFCYINDVAIGCMVLAEHVEKVLYLDIDVHHGDGVQDAFYDRADVMTISFHETGWTLFPGTGFESEVGVGEGAGYCVNVPLPPRTYDEAYLRAFRAIALPLIGAYDPDVIVLELGMDALAGDPLAHLALTNNTHAEVIQHVLSFGKPLLASGGGGYNPANTARGWALAWTLFCGEDTAQEMQLGLGGVMLETTEWPGGLRDRRLVPDAEARRVVEPAVDATIEFVRKHIFPVHGLA